MNLSPRTIVNARQHLMPARPLADEDENGYMEVTAYKCSRCGELYEWSSEARDCCSELKNRETKCACPVCGDEHDTYFQAVDCCLWIDLDFATRLKVAAALENGSDWKTELALA